MKYNGIELEEMTSEKWDGKSREMLVWDDESTCPYKEIVIGYNPDDNYWIADDGYYWHHCAEIPIVAEEDVLNLLNDNEKEILELKAENKRLKDKIESLKFDSIKMADSVSSAVWNELMERVANQESLISVKMPNGLGFNDISDIVLNKILNYKSDNKPEKKFRKMTYKELSEWLAKGNGQFKDGNFGSFRTELIYYKNKENTIVDNNCLIRGFTETEWHEPLIEE